ncbi:M20 family metallo-hydrolase [Cohnella sp.]|uniref:M20 family metallo-hydrolase n=1 Tax=Cohnella sp. TaxID=1883426 RepID=UPI0035631F0E
MEASDVGADVTKLLEELSRFGKDPDGGVTRLLYDSAWKKAQRFVASAMHDAGLEVTFDEIGNVYGKLAGADEAAPSILTGSHIDTVRSGGHYDGALGVAAGIAALSRLKTKYGIPRRSLEVVSFCEEEGSRFPLAYWGSGNVTGSKDFEGALDARDSEGITLREAMFEAGFDPESFRQSKRRDIGAFVELHIEQGEVLHRGGYDIGIVGAIFGQRRYLVEVHGRSGHAGTTPMDIREDALAACAEMIVWMRRTARETGDGLVATVGKLEVTPNVANVIPGIVRFTLDIRHSDERALDGFCELTIRAFSLIAKEMGVLVTADCWLSELPSPMNDELSKAISNVCDHIGLSKLPISSGAGHDAGLFANVCPTAMIFVPSRDGISHSPEEYTSPEQMACGTEVLTELLYTLAYLEEAT